ncbi:MAG TPA: YkvA family protein, partial [Gammaproteobacteria bacterium]|nr:YkvA family protein [Gammaproteobacteria bacterium]
MAVKIVLELDDKDLDYYRGVMDSIWKNAQKRSEKELMEGSRRLLKQATKAGAPEYVRSRLAELEALCAMLDDSEWPLEDDDRNRIRAALGYFALAKDMIPDKIPGLGFLDDALMADLVTRELKLELEGYEAFCEYRDNETKLRGKAKVSRL